MILTVDWFQISLCHCLLLLHPAGSPGEGPRFDGMGTFIPHSVLGSSEDYVNTLQSTGMVRIEKRKLCNPSEIFLLKFSHQSLLDCYSSPPLPLPLSLTTPCNTHSPLRLDQLQHSPSLHLWFCQEWRNPAPSWKRRATRRPLW